MDPWRIEKNARMSVRAVRMRLEQTVNRRVEKSAAYMGNAFFYLFV